MVCEEGRRVATYALMCKGFERPCRNGCGKMVCDYHDGANNETWFGGHVCTAVAASEPAKFDAPETLEFRRRGPEAEAAEASGDLERLTVLVFNCGLLRAKGPGGVIMFENPPFADERFSQLAAALLEADADIVALSEIYESKQVAKLIEQVRGKYPFTARQDNRSGSEKLMKFHNGLMYLSKHPLRDTKLVKHSRAAALEQIFGYKSFLMVKASCGTFGDICMANMHTTAGGSSHPEEVDEVRESELREAVEQCELARTQGCRTFVLGDLNMGPEASPANYDFMLKSGYTDEVIACKCDTDAEVFTWDPKNPLNATGPHKTCPPQRCDHVFVHQDAGMIGTNLKLMFTEATVETKKGPTTLSDHYGLLLTLRKRPVGAGAAAAVSATVLAAAAEGAPGASPQVVSAV